ncbi:RHS repeat-associated core domain-containing protein [Micromonospora pattaloongensis]|uniref:RHS repeat-associated core domain-containing protein n=1 Tax=Micromonospora pattaloongensis TaxID=405436 RepID=A0A1H3JR55_9ACTN|nr:polymorphic toxin-type HINT domain-containing protein [Micromonospora pattaloongensis]SDY42005.1 RHS repeat-associated core domain-containing protein [Micromonospora pattaloongensis]
MSAVSVRGSRRARRRLIGVGGRRPVLVGAVTVSLFVSLLPGVPAQATPPAKPTKPPVERLDGHGGPVTGKAWAQNRVKHVPAPTPAWPKAATARVELSAAAARTAAARGVRAGDLPVWVNRGAGKAGEQLSRVDVQVIDRTTVPQAWRDGLMLKVTAPQDAPAGAATVSVDYNAFRYAGGGSWAERLRLWQVPECALSTPDRPGCRSVPLRTSNDVAAGVASAQVTVGRSSSSTAAQPGSFVVLAAGGSGKSGDFAATGLAPSSTWSAGGSSGDFSWSYPLRIPPATGPAPSIALSYSSSAVDGRSEVTNNQPSWIGEGFDYSPGFIERRYVPCAEDMKTGANNTEDSGDQCWRSDNATMSLNGRGGELIFQAGKGWHSRAEDGSKIEKLTGASNGDAGDPAYGDVGEYWKVTTTDGTQYFFGLHSLPGHSAKTNSTLTVPVFGNHSGEPCRKTTFTGSDCEQAWRWNLDYVVDVHGNTMSLWYGKETNKYARNDTDSDDVTYDRAGYLTRIDYGTYDRTVEAHGVSERSVSPYAQVLFETDMRCFSNCGTESDPVADSWKDTPWDQECKASATSCPQQYQPTFWTTKRLKKITTRVWDTTKSTPAWQNVESWTLSHTFSATADSTHTGLWLDKIDHAGLVGGTVNLPPVTFEAESLPNRVLTEHGTTDNWLRISSIVTETGARIKVDYAQPECTEAIVEDLQPHTNTRRCYPVRVPDPQDPTGKALITEWWHKHRVEHVVENDVQLTDGHQAPAKHTWYTYVGSPAWHYADDDGLSKPDRKTWNQWRGYARVETRVGDDPAARTLAITTFMRGMHGDKASPSDGTRNVTVPASLGSETVYDHDQFAGQVREQVVYNGVATKPVSKTVNVPWRSNPTASRTINGDVVESRFVNTQTTYTSTALGVDGARGWRTSRGTKDLDHTYGTVKWSQDDGDLSKTGDEKCVTYSYNRNLTKNLTQTVKQTTTTALACGVNPGSADDVISDARSYYDNATSVDTAPRFGSVTKTEQLKDWAAGTGTVWQTVSQASYDSTGRRRTATDIKGNVTSTAYTPLVGGPVTKVATTGPAPFNWTSSVDVNPYWGSTIQATDPNDRVTSEVQYDALGRVAKVWQLGWSSQANPTRPSAQYSYTFAAGRDRYPYVMSQTLNPDGNYVTSYQILDALLRPRQTQSLSLGGSGDRVVTDTIYDEFGRAATSYGAHAEPGAPSGTLWWEPEWSVPAVSKTVFDQASRPTSGIFLAGDGITNLVEKWRTVTAYEGDLTKVTPPEGGTPTTTVTDIEGRTAALRQHTTPAGVAGAYQETKYVFNRKDQLVKTVDPGGNEWFNEYDVKGRLWRTTDPDKGVTTSHFNAFNELEKTVDARGEALWYVYDELGRKKALRDDSATGALRAEWKYDSLSSGKTGFKGQLTQAIRYEPAGSTNAYRWQVRDFNGRYQPTGVNYVIPTVESGLGATYVYAYGYAAATGTPTSISYPSGGGLVTEQLTTDYHATTGMPVRLDTSLTGSTGTMATASYTAYGERSGSIYKMPGGVYTQDTVYRDEATRRITRTTVERETVAGTVSDRNYTYDHVGNITSISETPQVGEAETQCFRHDVLGRLETAWTPKAGVTCQNAPTVADLGGPARYWHDWTFDNTGNRLTETSHADSGDTTRTYKVPTGGPNVVRPHAVTEMNTAAPGQSSVVSKYGYDEAGNTTCRPAGPTANDCATKSDSQTLAWNAEGKLATVTAASGQTIETNIYDTNGVRLIRRDLTGTTLYLPGQEIRREGGVSTGTRYYSFAGNICASRKAGSAISDLTWLYGDHQGTQQTAINAGTQAVDIRRQTPYGGPRGENPTWVNGKGFVGGDIDPTGLTNIGARQYDQLLGRFISVDPVMDLADPQQWNAYAYSYNSPISHADPTGEDPCPGGGGGCYYDGTTTRYDGVTPEQMKAGLQQTQALLPQVAAKVAAQQQAREEADRKQRECQASFWCRNASTVGMVAGIAAGVIVGAACTIGSFGVGAVGCAAIGGFVGGAVGSLVTNGLDADEESAGGLALEALGGGVIGGVMGVGGALLGAAAFGAGVAVTSGMGLKAAGQMAMSGMRSSVTASGRGAGGLRGCVNNSFAPGTSVVMADGTTKRIEEIQVGDTVLATDPNTGETDAKPVAATIVGKGAKNLVQITTDNDGDDGQATGTVIATDKHPFWVPELGQWRDATELAPGQWLQTSAGTYVQITAIGRWTQTAQVYNLNVADIHTYYVLAGSTPVLVHNCGKFIAGPNLGSLRVSAANPSASEIAAAQHMAARGGNVVLRDPVGTRSGGMTSDLLVDGVAWDVYSPTSGSVNNILTNIAKKHSQVNGGGVVVDLSGTGLSVGQFGNALNRVNGMIGSWGKRPIGGLEFMGG